MNPHDSERLEAAIQGVLRGLPDRKAPSGFEARVLAELARRAALPWWRRSFSHWPSAVRAGFYLGSALAAYLLVRGLFAFGSSQSAHQLAGGLSTSFAWLVLARDVLASLDRTARLLLSAINPLWLYGAAALIAACYAALGAIGAAAYRTVSLARQNS